MQEPSVGQLAQHRERVQEVAERSPCVVGALHVEPGESIAGGGTHEQQVGREAESGRGERDQRSHRDPALPSPVRHHRVQEREADQHTVGSSERDQERGNGREQPPFSRRREEHRDREEEEEALGVRKVKEESAGKSEQEQDRIGFGARMSLLEEAMEQNHGRDRECVGDDERGCQRSQDGKRGDESDQPREQRKERDRALAGW